MTHQHKKLAAGRWQKFSLSTQLAHIGSEIIRADIWRKKGNKEYEQLAFVRALELLDLSLQPMQPLPRLQELTRLRECAVDYFMEKNEYGSSPALWQSYFLAFTIASRMKK